MNKVINLSLGDDIIGETADFICKNFALKHNNLARVMCVFGGKRPALFLRRAIGKNLGCGFVPPKIFSMDNFVDHLSGNKDNPFLNLDAAYFIYNYAKEHAAKIISNHKNFAEFLPWAGEIISFIEQLDLECVHDSQLLNVQASAQIGYEVPAGVNAMLRVIVDLRRAFHDHFKKERMPSRGMRYFFAAQEFNVEKLEDFDAIIFCGFYYLHQSEQKIIKQVCDQNKAVLIFQGFAGAWSVIGESMKALGQSYESCENDNRLPEFSLHEAFDIHSQVCAARQVLQANKNNNNTVVVLPRVEMLIPFLSQNAGLMGDFNVSLGYPVKRSAFFHLFELLFKAQEGRRGDLYYTHDYLNLLRHPLVKNLALCGEAATTRILVHRLEKLLSGEEKSSLGGRLFIDCASIEAEEAIYGPVKETLSTMDIEVSLDDLRWLIKELHFSFFKNWQEAKNFGQFGAIFGQILNLLIDKSAAWKFPFNVKVARKLYEIKDEFASLSFSGEEFSPLQIWEILRRVLSDALVSFSGSPLRGAQILGLLETRTLCFDNVIVMDLNEGVMPRLKLHEPLIPREVMLLLGLNRLEKEEEIQRYHFMRLIAGAKNVNFIYESSPSKEKSRFIEELLWRQQKETKSLEMLMPQKINFPLKIELKNYTAVKTPAMVEFLKNCVYSASRVNSYLNCPLEFYYRYVLGLNEREDMLDDVEARHIGTFIHELLEDTLAGFINKKPVIDKNFRTLFFKKLEEKFSAELMQRMRSESFLLKKIIITRMEKFLEIENKRSIKRIVALETERWGKLKMCGAEFSFVYKADRIDEMESGEIIVIDYKTGGAGVVPKKLKELRNLKMTREEMVRSIRSFQLPLYYAFTKENYPNTIMNAEVYNLRTLERVPFISQGDLSEADEVLKICLQALECLFAEILNPEVPFTQTSDTRRCGMCPFKMMCG